MPEKPVGTFTADITIRDKPDRGLTRPKVPMGTELARMIEVAIVDNTSFGHDEVTVRVRRTDK